MNPSNDYFGTCPMLLLFMSLLMFSVEQEFLFSIDQCSLTVEAPSKM